MIKRVIEALLLVADKPITIDMVKEALGVEPREVRQAIDELQREYRDEKRGFQIKDLAGGFQFVTDPALTDVIRNFIQTKEKRRLSQASLETLSIIAYRQPMTKPEIEQIRGVNVDASLKTLLEKGLIRISGRKEVAGRPLLYSTTKDFLDHFGLGSLKELPQLADFKEKDIEIPEQGRRELSSNTMQDHPITTKGKS